MRSRFSWLDVVAAIALALLCGAAAYLAVFGVARLVGVPGFASDPAPITRTGILEPTSKPSTPGPDVTQPNISLNMPSARTTVGKYVRIDLTATSANGAPLPAGYGATAVAKTPGITVAGPNVDTSQNEQSWSWTASADQPGEYVVSVTAETVDHAYARSEDVTISVTEKPNWLLGWLETTNDVLKSAAATLGTVAAVLAALATVVAQRRKLKRAPRAKKPRPTRGQPPAKS